MAQSTKRVAVSSVNWAKLSESLTTEHQSELERLKQQNSTFHSEIVQHKADLPKVDWAALKKQMPDQSAALDTLQKQWESLSIPYGNIPDNLVKEIGKWTEYNKVRMDLHDQKTKDGLERMKKVEEKWAKAPPVEHMYEHMHYPIYFPHEYGAGEKLGYADLRVYHDDGEWRYWGYILKADNEDAVSHWRKRFFDYEVLPRAGNAKTGMGVPDYRYGQMKRPTAADYPEPLTELGRKYVENLKKTQSVESTGVITGPVGDPSAH